MRQENYEESEKLFVRALAAANYPDHKKTTAVNLAVLLRKMGKSDQANQIENEYTQQLQRERKRLQINPKSNNIKSHNALKASARKDSINLHIKHLDKEIEKADSAGKLNHLQNLFKKKAELLKKRDGMETMEYAYCLHFRAQVLGHMKRKTESRDLEERACKLRDALIKLQQRRIASPEIAPSRIKDLNFHF